jgi:hypothetical protein
MLKVQDYEQDRAAKFVNNNRALKVLKRASNVILHIQYVHNNLIKTKIAKVKKASMYIRTPIEQPYK